jgi:alanine racemase
MNRQTQLGIFEAGISKPNEMLPLYKIINPTIGVLTNIGGAHQENFSTLQDKCIEKLNLFRKCDILVYDADNELIQGCVNKAVMTAGEIAWSKKNQEKPLFISAIEKSKASTTVKYRYLGLDNQYSIPFIDDASIENSIHCLAVCLYLMLSPDTIAERMAKLEPLAMRLEVKDGKNNCIIINDSYNSDISSLSIALDFMERRHDDKSHSRTLILSDILQTGWLNNELYKRVKQLVEGRGITKLIGVGKNISSVSKIFDVDQKYFFDSTEKLLSSQVFKEIKNELVLVKGARSFNFDRITERLELKVHETILEVNLNAIVNNLDKYRSMLSADTKIACMVKASAYGTGAIEVAKTLQDCKVDYLAVAVADEGRELRNAGITTSIMVMNPERTSFKLLFDYKLEPEIYSFHLLEELIRAAEHNGITNFPIHIKIDTGMHRLGFAPSDIPELVRRLKRQTAVIPSSVFSHFAGSDSAYFDDYSEMQVEKFKMAADTLQEAFRHYIARHICNSAGIERLPQQHFDMVRLGLGLYGVNPINNQLLDNVATLKTTILQIRNLPKGETVGYSRKGVLERDSKIAALPIGYADGLNRRLGNRNAYCLVNGKKAYYVGNICMDVCMIDVTDIECSEGDTVEIFGPSLPVTVLSDVLGTIPYEILSTISTRVKRVYYTE